MRENTHGSLHPPTHASSINSFFLKVKSNIQSSPLISKTVIYFSLFASIPLNVLLKLDEKVLFTSYDVIARFEWYRLFTSILYVNSDYLVCCSMRSSVIDSYLTSNDILGSFRCFFQLFEFIVDERVDFTVFCHLRSVLREVYSPGEYQWPWSPLLRLRCA